MKIEAYTAGWCDIDRLDGIDLKGKEVLELVYPDGTTAIKTIKVKKSSHTVSDMGHDVSIPVSKAYIPVDFRGVKYDLPIVGLQAKRVQK